MASQIAKFGNPSSGAKFTGVTALLEQPIKMDWEPQAGWKTTRTWEGSMPACMAFLPILKDSGAESISLQGEGPTGKVSASFPQAQDDTLDANQGALNVEWELLGSDLEKNLKTHNEIISQTAATEAQRLQLAEAAKAVIEATPFKASWYAGAQAYYRLSSQGVEAYVLTQYVLRKTIKVARTAMVQASLANVNKVEAPTEVPTDLFLVPTQDGQGALEWLKKPPQVRFLGRGKFSITQEWWGAFKWSAGLYGGTGIP